MSDAFISEAFLISIAFSPVHAALTCSGPQHHVQTNALQALAQPTSEARSASSPRARSLVTSYNGWETELCEVTVFVRLRRRRRGKDARSSSHPRRAAWGVVAMPSLRQLGCAAASDVSHTRCGNGVDILRMWG